MKQMLSGGAEVGHTILYYYMIQDARDYKNITNKKQKYSYVHRIVIRRK